MSRYLFNEEIIREDKRSGTYLIKFIILAVVFYALAAAVWVIQKIPFIAGYISQFLAKIQTFCGSHNLPVPTYTHLQIIFCIIFAAIGSIILIAGIVGLVSPHLYLTQKRVCLIKGKHKYRETRFDKIESIRIKGRKLILYAGKSKLAFGPLSDPYTARDAIVAIMTHRFDEEDSKQTRCSEPEPISKDGDVFDADTA